MKKRSPLPKFGKFHQRHYIYLSGILIISLLVNVALIAKLYNKVPTSSVSNSKMSSVINLDDIATITCPVDLTCQITNNVFFVKANDQSSVLINIQRMNSEILNHPGYHSVIDWYYSLKQKNDLAIGAKLDPNYGVTTVPGTDEKVFPFYRTYDLNTISIYTFMNHSGLSVISPSQLTFDFLIPTDPTAGVVYRFTIGTLDEKSINLAHRVLSTLSFKSN